MKKLKVVGILAVVVLIVGSLSIPLINNHTAYKAEKSHESAVQIMKEMAQAGEIDPMIVDDLEKLFRR